MKVEITGNGEKKIEIVAETPFEWDFIKGLIQMSDPIALTKFLQDRGFITDGNNVVDLIDMIEEKMEAN